MLKKTFAICALLVGIVSYSQDHFSINDFIENSKKSIEYANFKKEKLLDEKENLLFEKKFLPDVSLNFTLPTYNRSISNVIQPDGTIAFRESNNANSRVNLSVSQKIPFTGGELSVTNSFNRLDLFRDEENTTSYSASWIGINLSQPLNFFNSIKWDKKIYKAKLEYNDISYIRKNIEIKKKAIDNYFALMSIKNQKIIIENKIDVAIKYNNIIKKLIETGKVMAYDSVDSKLKILSIQKNINFINKSEILKTDNINTFFNSKVLKKNDVLEVPRLEFQLDELNHYINKYLEAYAIIEENSLIGLEKSFKQQQKNRFYNATLTMGIGFNNSTEIFNNILQNPNQSQNFSLSLNIPLLDFGKKRIELEVSKTEYDIKVSDLAMEKNITIQRITFLYEEINDLILGLKIEKERTSLLKIKLDRIESLLYVKKILLRDFSESESEYYSSLNDQLSILRNIYNKVIELEEVTFFEII
tara:strand:+ start:11307 stop:12725 length:1419 start_codon:yes stop_codon:yes gene_type:complete